MKSTAVVNGKNYKVKNMTFKMTFEELLNMPKGMRIEEYSKLLKKKKRIGNRLRKVSDLIYDEEDSLDVLSDEIGSDRYNRHLEKKQELENERAKLNEQFEQLEAIL